MKAKKDIKFFNKTVDVADRDTKSAITILHKAIKQVGEHNLNLQESFITDLLSNGSRLNNLVDSRSQAL